MVSDLEKDIYMQNQLLKDTDCFSMANSIGTSSFFKQRFYLFSKQD